MNEETSSAVLSDPGDVLADSSADLAVAADAETVEVVGEVVQDRPFLTTRFEEYSVTEGLLLMLLLFCFISSCVRMLKGGFAWLLS